MDLLTNLFTLLDMKSSVAVLCLLAATMIFMITEAHDPSYKRANLAGPKVFRKRAIITAPCRGKCMVKVNGRCRRNYACH